MIDVGKRNVLGILIDAVDYEVAVERILRAAREGWGAAVSPVAVHGLMTGVFNPEQKHRLNHFDLLVPDGHPVRCVLDNICLAFGTRQKSRNRNDVGAR